MQGDQQKKKKNSCVTKLLDPKQTNKKEPVWHTNPCPHKHTISHALRGIYITEQHSTVSYYVQPK